jgi:YfiR/HmsC-like
MTLRRLFFAALLAWAGSAAALAEELPEYRLKAAFIFNFLAFTDWPSETGATLNLCIHGADPFGADIDGLQGKTIGARSVAVHRRASIDALKSCQAVFVTRASIDALPRVLDGVKGHPVLVVADSPGAMQRGAALNMNVSNARVTFEANLQAARSAGLGLSSKLLRLATEVQQ